MTTICLQLFFAFILLLLGAKGFITGIEEAAKTINISVLLLSILVIPIATELPEKVNSIIWVYKGKDTLAMSNITGAMVFQGTLLPAIGILLTPWQPSKLVLTGIVITLIAGAWLRYNVSSQGLRITALLLNGGLYMLYLWLTLR
jgi:cation:H+ antiporter